MFKWSGLYTGIYYTYTANKEEKNEAKHDDEEENDKGEEEELED